MWSHPFRRDIEAIAAYNELIRLADGTDWVTQDLAVQLLTDEENHQRAFQGFLAEYEETGG